MASLESAKVMQTLQQIMERLDSQQQQIRALQPTTSMAAASATDAPPLAGERRWDDLLGSLGDGDSESEGEFTGLQARLAKPVELPVRSALLPPPPPAKAPPPQGPADVQGLLQLETLKILKKLHKREDSSGDDVDGKGGNSGGLRGVQRLRERVEKDPERVIRDYIAAVQLELGVSDTRQFWCFRDFSKKLLPRFGRMRGMYRCHVMSSDILQQLHEGRPVRAAALLVQFQKAVLQMALDNGSWDSASLLWPGGDPLGQREFGGTEAEMKAVHAYRKALQELRNRAPKSESPRQGDAGDDTAAGSGRGGKKGPRGRGKNQPAGEEGKA
jgi:hypothetical protein